jgi:outer membrane protein assembly factor BamB
MSPIHLPALILLFASSRSPQEGWPTWRGPTGDGVAAPEARPPLTWDEDTHVRWKVELPGLGNSSPIVGGERIYLTTAIDLAELEGDQAPRAQPGPPQADGPHRFVVLALDRASGETVWATTVCEATPHEKGHVTASHASPSITLAGDRLVASFGSRGLYVLDLDGNVQWSADLGDMETLVAFGEGSTPAVHDGTIVVQWDEEGPSFVVGLDLASGEERWRFARDHDSSWGSPTVTTVDGKAQVVLTGSGVTQAHDVATGELLWSAPGMSKNPVTSALAYEGLVFVMNSYEGNVVQAIDLASAHGKVDDEHGIVWTRGRDASYVPTPVAHDGRLYFLRDSRGQLTCLDAVTGEEHYASQRLEGLRTVHSSPIIAAGRLYVTSREGTTVVLREGDELEVLATNTLDDVFDATPAFVGDAIYLRGRSHLYCLAE